MRKTARRLPARAIGVGLVVALLSLLTVTPAFAQWVQPSGITNEANDMHDLYLLVTVMALIVFVAVEGALLFIIFRFRRKKGDTALPPQIHGNNALEIVWTTIPIVIVLVLFVFSVVTLVSVEEGSDPEDLTIHMQGFQFQWAATYNENDIGPDSKADSQRSFTIRGTAGEENEPTFVIPIGEPVEFTLESPDVIHSFYIHDFLYKLDVIPGRNNKFTVTANELGTFRGQCAELCGVNHALMRFHLKVVSREEFNTWVTSQFDAESKNAAKVP